MITRTKTEVIIKEETETRYLISDLKAEKERIEAELKVKEPSKEELIDLGRSMHEYYMPKDHLENRLKVINDLLG
jgi:hypothetical protein